MFERELLGPESLVQESPVQVSLVGQSLERELLAMVVLGLA